VGGSFGVLMQPSRDVRVGVVYRSPMEFTFKDTLRVTDRGAIMEELADAVDIERTDVEITLRVSQEGMASVVWQATPGWHNWEDVGDVKVNVDAAEDIEASTEVRMLDTWHFAVGTRFQSCRRWTASLGWAYDTSALELDARSPLLPVDRQIRYSTGIQYDWSEKVTLGLNYTLLDMGRNSIDKEGSPLTGHLSGSFDKSYAHFVGLNMRWRF
jgi:long-chain fatty acid transport protein